MATVFGNALRALRQSPAFTVTALATIGLAIGAATSVFSVAGALLLRPLPYTDPSRLVLVWGDLKTRNLVDLPFSPPDFDELRKSATLFQDFAAVSTGRAVVPAENAAPELVHTGQVTPNFFRLLGERVSLGRDFQDADSLALVASLPPAASSGLAGRVVAPLQPPVIAILSHEFWVRRFAGNPQVVGRSIDFGNGKAQVVGVLAPAFELLFPPKANLERMPEIWTAIRADFQSGTRANVALRVIGRMKPGVSSQEAQAQIDGIAAELRQRYPMKATAGLHFRLEPIEEDLTAEVRPSILALAGAAIFLLLIACGNLANLVLLRGSARVAIVSGNREERDRGAGGPDGSPRFLKPLVSHMSAEAVLLAAAGAILGLGVARLGIRLAVVLAPMGLPRLESAGIEPVVLGLATLPVLLAGAVFGALPAWRTLRGGRWLGNVVLVTEVAFSFVLVIGSGLMLRSYLAMERTDPGYDPQGILTFFLPVSSARTPEERAALMQEICNRLRGLPGVNAVTASSPYPLDGSNARARWGNEEALADPDRFNQANLQTVIPGYFETLRTRVLAGRTFTEADNSPVVKAVVIDQPLAAKAFPHQPAVGKRLLVRLASRTPEWYEVIGVVAHQRREALATEGRDAIFVTDGLMGYGRAVRWAVRTEGDPERLAPLVRAEIAHFDTRLAVGEVLPMQALLDRAQAPARFVLIGLAILGALAVLLALTGLSSVLSGSAREPSAEGGLAGQGLHLSVMGIALGVLGALSLTRVLSSLLVGVEPNDPLTFAAIAGLFLGIAVLASWLPARRMAP